MVVATRKLKQNRKLPLRDLPPVVRGAGVVVEGACPLVVPIGRLSRRGTGLVEVLNGVLKRPGMGLAHPRCSASSRLLQVRWRKMDLHVPGSMSKSWRCPSAYLQSRHQRPSVHPSRSAREGTRRLPHNCQEARRKTRHARGRNWARWGRDELLQHGTRF